MHWIPHLHMQTGVLWLPHLSIDCLLPPCGKAHQEELVMQLALNGNHCPWRFLNVLNDVPPQVTRGCSNGEREESLKVWDREQMHREMSGVDVQCGLHGSFLPHYTSYSTHMSPENTIPIRLWDFIWRF